MTIRSFQAGDEAAQVKIYNETAANLPKFKPAAQEEVRRRVRAADFDPAARFFAVEGTEPVGYAGFLANGRVSFPWCKKGHERHAEALFDTMLKAMKTRGMRTAFSAYRGDWVPQEQFFLAHGFQRIREMNNYVLDLVDMPTPSARPNPWITPMQPQDLAAVNSMGSGILRAGRPEELGQHLFHNPYFPASSVFVLRGQAESEPIAAGILIDDAAYAHPKQVDAAMPCFRLGAFGTEGMQTKRINGLFSFLAPAGGDVNQRALSLLNFAAMRLQEGDADSLAAQAPSDAVHLDRFYQQYFRKQGSFPIFERLV